MLDGWMGGKTSDIANPLGNETRKILKRHWNILKTGFRSACCLADRHTQDLQSNEIGREGFICQSLCENGAMTDQECVRRGLEEEWEADGWLAVEQLNVGYAVISSKSPQLLFPWSVLPLMLMFYWFHSKVHISLREVEWKSHQRPDVARSQEEGGARKRFSHNLLPSEKFAPMSKKKPSFLLWT